MRIKKTGGKIYGADLTAAEKRAMNMEIQRQLAEYDMKNTNEIDALILWSLHETFGFGHKRLKKFHETFEREMKSLLDRYALDDSDEVWICTHKLKQYGIDIEQWNK